MRTATWFVERPYVPNQSPGVESLILNWVCAIPTGFEWLFSAFQLNSFHFPLFISLSCLFFCSFPTLSIKYLRSEATSTTVQGSWWGPSSHLPVGSPKVSPVCERACPLPLQRVGLTKHVEGGCCWVSCWLWGLGARTTDSFTGDREQRWATGVWTESLQGLNIKWSYATNLELARMRGQTRGQMCFILMFGAQTPKPE